MKKDGVYSDLCRREIGLEFLEDFVSEICCLILNCRFKRNSKLIAANESASDGEADGFATTNENGSRVSTMIEVSSLDAGNGKRGGN